MSTTRLILPPICATGGEGVNSSPTTPLKCGLGHRIGRGVRCIPPSVCGNPTSQIVSSNLSATHVCVPYNSVYTMESASLFIDAMNSGGHSSSMNIVYPVTDICLKMGFGSMDEFRACQRCCEECWNQWLNTGMQQADPPVLDVNQIVPDYANLAEAEA